MQMVHEGASEWLLVPKSPVLLLKVINNERICQFKETCENRKVFSFVF